MREIFCDAAGEREIAPKCGSLPRDAGNLVGLHMVSVTPGIRKATSFRGNRAGVKKHYKN